MCIFARIFYLNFSLREQRTLAKMYYFVLVSWNWMNDREAFQSDVFDSERPNISQKCVTIINQWCVSNYYRYLFMVFCPICPSLVHGIAIHYVQHCQAILEFVVCELAHSFFHLYNYIKKCMVYMYKVAHINISMYFL